MVVPSPAPKETDSEQWCFADSPNGKKCLGRAGHTEDHAAYSSANAPFEVWPRAQRRTPSARLTE